MQKSQTPIEHRIGTVDDIAQVVAWLASEESRAINRAKASSAARLRLAACKFCMVADEQGGASKRFANTAAWLPGVGKPLEVRPADIPAPGEGELLIEVKAVAVQPAEYKIQDGVLPFPLRYPTIVGLVNVGSTVTRFKTGDRVVTNSAGRKVEKVLIWGASSSFGAYATRLAVEAGYTVVGVASARNAQCC
ncbi:hypothetical protein FOFC_17576 [Fusarium oxysporum]|nr:hypothetical protein FOFC_17576 [Fusarium oxysporum]